MGGRWTESGSAVHMATQHAAMANAVRCIGHCTALCFWRQTDACWCAVPFDSGLTAEQGRCREGKQTRSSPSQTEVGTLHPHISHLILARGIAPSHLSYPMQNSSGKAMDKRPERPCLQDAAHRIRRCCILCNAQKYGTTANAVRSKGARGLILL